MRCLRQSGDFLGDVDFRAGGENPCGQLGADARHLAEFARCGGEHGLRRAEPPISVCRVRGPTPSTSASRKVSISSSSAGGPAEEFSVRPWLHFLKNSLGKIENFRGFRGSIPSSGRPIRSVAYDW